MNKNGRGRSSHRIVALTYEGLCLFEFAIVTEIFGQSRPEISGPWYDYSIASVDPFPKIGIVDARLSAQTSLGALADAETIVIPGWRGPGEPVPAELTHELIRAHKRGARLVSICSGVFVLAATGLLDGRKATTHWRYVEELSRQYSRIVVQPDVLFVDGGDILTSAGSAAGIDLCLHVVRQDYGATAAAAVARRLVVAPQREGGQAQFIPEPMMQSPDSFAPLLTWAIENLHRPLPIEILANEAAMSPRTFARKFRSEMGTTPHRWLVSQRLAASQRLLETSPISIETIAQNVGFVTAETLRHHFRIAFSTTPTAYRRRFRVDLQR